MDWQAVRDCPIRDELALLSLCSDKGLRLQLWNSSGWGSPVTVTADCGVSTTRVCDAAYEGVSGELLVAYRKASGTGIYYRSYTTASPSEQLFAAGLNTQPRWVGLAPMPGSDTMVLLVATDVRLYGAVWNGSSFGNLTTLETSLPGVGFPCAGAASAGAGKTLVAWGTTAASGVRYATWSGSAWSSVATAAAASGTVYGVVLSPNPAASSTDILMACLDAASDIRVCRWSGSAWGAATTIETNAGSAAEQRVGLSFTPNGSAALVAWHQTGQNALRYRTWNGTAWSSTGVGTDMGSETSTILVEPGPGASDTSIAVRHHGPGVAVGDYNAYAQSGTATVNGTAVGPVDDQVPGVTLPAAPTNAAGTTDKTYGNNATATLAPGAYKKLTAGNNLTLNISSGTYVFTSVSLGSSATFNADTSSGDISLIVKTGSFDALNNFRVITTGGGQVTIHVVSGSFDAKNNADMDASVLAYSGSVTLGNNATVDGALFASASVTTGTNAVLTNSYQPYPPSNARLSLLHFSGGSMSAATACSTSVSGWSGRQNFSLLRPSAAETVVRVTRWREVKSDE